MTRVRSGDIAGATPTSIIADMSCREAEALAQFVKRVTWAEILSNAIDEDEAVSIREALERLRLGLVDSGFDPR